MSALLPKADMFSVGIDVRYVPNADIQVCNIFATVEPRNRDVDHFLLGGPASTEKDFTQPKIKKCHLVAGHDQPCSL